MSEKLQELHQIKISRETVRQLMIQEGVWNPKNKKSPVIHQQRQRIISKKVGAPSNHQLPKELKPQVIKLIFENYHDFGPTLAHQ